MLHGLYPSAFQYSSGLASPPSDMHAETGFTVQADIRSLSAVHGSFGDVFGENQKEKEQQILKLARQIAEQTTDRGRLELKLLPYRS